MKIACVSDTHGRWPTINYPDADILVFAGDILGNYNTSRGDVFECHKQLEELNDLNSMCRGFKKAGKYKEIIVVCGNHDWVFEKMPQEARGVLKDVAYLQDEAIHIGDKNGGLIKFYGSPWQPWFWDWAFNFPDHNGNFFRARDHARSTWNQIPDDVEVLITHGPPHAIMDECDDGRHVGCTWLRERLDELPNLQLHIFGHIHHSHGYDELFGVQYVNASYCKEYYRKDEPPNPVRVVEI